jgi:hypothetical protein
MCRCKRKQISSGSAPNTLPVRPTGEKASLPSHPYAGLRIWELSAGMPCTGIANLPVMLQRDFLSGGPMRAFLYPALVRSLLGAARALVLALPVGLAFASPPDESPWGVSASASSARNHAEWFPRMAEAGVRWVRLFPEWSTLEPVRGQWKWDAADTLAASARKHGLTLNGVLMGSPPGSKRIHTFPMDDLPGWSNFVARAALLHRGHPPLGGVELGQRRVQRRPSLGGGPCPAGGHRPNPLPLGGGIRRVAHGSGGEEGAPGDGEPGLRKSRRLAAPALSPCASRCGCPPGPSRFP